MPGIDLIVYGHSHKEMPDTVIGSTLLGSFVGAFVIQKVALEGFFRILGAERRIRH